MIAALTRLLVNSPLYPHWLEHRKMRQGNDLILKGIKGQVIEVGAGDGTRKQEIMNAHPKIKKYLATDFSSWDEEFDRIGAQASRFGRVGEVFMGRQTRLSLDDVCSATKLPYKPSRFDAHLSFEVLEHIDKPLEYFAEARKVVKKGGQIIFSVPFLYREHKMDYYRYTGDFFDFIAKENNLKLTKLYSNTGFGTTCAVMANQWLVRRIMEGPLVLRPFLLLIAPIYFCFYNLVGLLIDVRPDTRFATRYHVVFKKL